MSTEADIKAFEFGELDKNRPGILFLHGWTSSPRELRFLAQHISEPTLCPYHPDAPKNWSGARCFGPTLPGHAAESSDLNELTSLDYIRAVTHSLETLQAQCKRVYIVGMSFGGALALQLARSNSIAGLILLAPFINLTDSKILGVSKKSIVQFLPESTPDINKGEPGIKDPLARSDHFSYSQTSVHSLKVFFDTVDQCTRDLQEVNTPTLLMHSTNDKTSDFQNSVHILSKISSDDKRLVALSKSNHIITLDYDRNRVEQEVKNWILAQEQ